jgi:hypothetical protein
MSEEGPVDPRESVFRRIPIIPNSYDPSLATPVGALAFRPTDDDVDGISLYRELFVSAQDVARSARKPASFYVVARLNAAEILALDVRLVPTPGNLPGHVSIPEINKKDYADKAKKLRIVELNRYLAVLASKDIVADFEDVPTEADD